MDDFDAEFAKFESEINSLPLATADTTATTNDTAEHNNGKKRKLDSDTSTISSNGSRPTTPRNAVITSKPVLYTAPAQVNLYALPQHNNTPAPYSNTLTQSGSNNSINSLTHSASNNSLQPHNNTAVTHTNAQQRHKDTAIAQANQLQSQLDSTAQQTTQKPILRAAAGEVWVDPTLAEWKPNDYRLFVGDLGNDVNDKNLQHLFQHYKSFDRCRVIRNHTTGKTKGYGFVSFLDADDAMHALKHMQGVVCVNRPISLKRSEWGDKNLDKVKQREEADGIHLLKLKKQKHGKNKKYHIF